MGILNVTPDSFSDGGLYGEIRNALTRAQVMKQEGADLIDIGGESTRPGAERVDVATQLSRIIPVLEALIGDAELSSRLLISVDTTQR
jgi:dihydropteroate synthase